MSRRLPVFWSVVAVAALAAAPAAQDPPDQPRFRGGVDLINVTVTVTDAAGRFVAGLSRDDFVVLDDTRPQELAYFAAERVPVSLGIAIDTSGSMAGQKWTSARRALDRFLFDLLGAEDEVFLYRFSDEPDLVQSWTTDRRQGSRALGRITPEGGTALYDAVANAVPFAQSGTHRKRALVVISDGNDTSSVTRPEELRRLVRRSDVLVYAIGVDGEAEEPGWTRQPPRFPLPRGPGRIPGRLPIPGQPPMYPPDFPPRYPPAQPPPVGGRPPRPGNDRVNIAALRALTDESGGRTEVVRDGRDLEPATAGIADELSRQYHLAYAAPPRDGRWHAIEVRVRGDHDVVVRHRRGYQAGS